jgi:hypothetical protein
LRLTLIIVSTLATRNRKAIEIEYLTYFRLRSLDTIIA